MNQHHNKGFTIIELTLAMAFVSLLLIAITMTVIQMANIYTRGVTLKEVNQLGMSLSQDMQSSIGASSPLSVSGDDAVDYRKMAASDSSEIAGGRLCTGSVSYIWNFGKYMNSPVNKYDSDDAPLRLAKIEDRGKVYCSNLDMDVVRADASEMLADGERDVVLHAFTISDAAHDSVLQQALYHITFEVGTNDEGSLNDPEAAVGVIESVDTSCKPPGEAGSLQSYCAVNKFEFTARAGNRGELR